MADGKRARTLKYGDARAFYERTFITEGMGHLLTQVSERLNSKGGEPVIQLQIRPTPRRLRAFPCEDPNPQGIRST